MTLLPNAVKLDCLTAWIEKEIALLTEPFAHGVPLCHYLSRWPVCIPADSMVALLFFALDNRYAFALDRLLANLTPGGPRPRH
jgi:hypothetical protein